MLGKGDLLVNTYLEKHTIKFLTILIINQGLKESTKSFFISCHIKLCPL